MQKRNSSYEFPEDEGQNKTSANGVSPKENVRLLLEVEVTESLYAAISRDEDYSAERGGVIEVTIVHPGRMDPLRKTAEEQLDKGGKFHREKLSQSSAGNATERRGDAPRIDERKNKSFVIENLLPKLFAAMKVGGIVGELPSEFTLKERNEKICHGDHYDEPTPFDPKISHTKIGRKNDAEKLLRPYVDSFHKYEERVRSIQPCVYPLVYQLHLQREDQQKCPLVEVSVAQKILEAYGADKSSCFNNSQQNFDVIRKTLMEWASDEKIIEETLSADSFALMKCEKCGVISYRKEEARAKLNGGEEGKNVEKWKRSAGNIDMLFQPREKTLKNEYEGDSKGFENLKNVRNRDGKSIFKRPLNTDEISSALTTDTVAAEREADSVSENRKSTDVRQKKVLKSGLPLFVTNRYGQCSSVREKNERLHDARFKSTYSTQYSSRQTAPKTGKKLIRNIPEDNRYRCNFDDGKNEEDKFPRTSPAPLIEPSKDIKTAIPAPLLQDSPRKNKYANSLLPASNIPTKLEKIGRNIGIKEGPAIVEKEKTSSKAEIEFSIHQSKAKQNFIPSDCKIEENEFRSKGNHDLCRSLKSQTLKGLQDEKLRFNNLRKITSHSQSYSSGEKLSTDQEYRSIINNQQTIRNDNDQRSFNGLKNLKSNQIGGSVISDHNYFTPLIDSARQISVNKDFVTTEHYLPEVNSPGRFTGESETTAFSSSSSENAIREWNRSFSQDPMVVFNVNRSPPDGAIKKSDGVTADSEEKFRSRETLIIGEAERKSFDKWSSSTLKTTYKNPSTVISSSSECIGEDSREPDRVRQRSSSDEKTSDGLRLEEHEKFERQVKYDEISGKEISEESRLNLESKALPVYRKIVESKDKMDWETFQQLVGTLHPSQRELWCDICKAVSNEAKRVSGETGAATEVCIEINPVPTSETFTCEKRSLVNTSGNEAISFEMDMIFNDFDSYLEKKLSNDIPKRV